MIAVDSNVLIAAHRGEHPLHERALARLVEVGEGEAPWALPVFCLAEFLRVVTHPRVFTPPSSLDVALTFLDRLLESPAVRLLSPGTRFWSHLRSVTVAADAIGNLAFDAQIAAVCREHGADRLITADRDFARFPDLRLEVP